MARSAGPPGAGGARRADVPRCGASRRSTTRGPAHEVTVDEHGRARFDGAGPDARPRDATCRSTRDGRGVAAEFTLREGETAIFVLRAGRDGTARARPARRREARGAVRGDGRRSGGAGSSHCTYRGRWREMVHRSALVLKLLTFEPTGAIVAAPTCSLPEAHRRRAQLGLPLHLDPRRRVHALRAAAHRLHRGGRRSSWTGSRRAAAKHRATDGPLQIVYGIDGRHDLTEETLDHLEGYRGSRPVRIGNGAVRAAPARHLRRADGLGLPVQQARRADLATTLWTHLRELRRLGLRQLAARRTRASGRCAAAGSTSSTRS